MNDINKFRNLIKAAYPGFYVTVSITLAEDAVRVSAEEYHARLAGPGLDASVESTRHNAAAVLEELKPAAAKSRRRFETRRVLDYCTREAGDTLTEEQRDYMREQLLAVRGKDAFESLAATYRKEAQRLGVAAQQAA